MDGNKASRMYVFVVGRFSMSIDLENFFDEFIAIKTKKNDFFHRPWQSDCLYSSSDFRIYRQKCDNSV